MSTDVVTLEELHAAVASLLGERLGKDEIEDLVRRTMNYFGFDDSVVDNTISSKDRDIFYLLEEVGLVSTLEDESFVGRGKRWRIHYWVLSKEKIKSLAYENEVEKEEAKSIYEDWDESWTRKGGGKNI